MAGLAATSVDMYETADSYMEEYQLFDLDVKSPIGFTEDDICAISEMEGIESAKPACVMDAVLDVDSSYTMTCRVFGFLDSTGNSEMNGFILKEGRLPSSSGECLIQVVMDRYLDDKPSIGSLLEISDENDDPESLKSGTDSSFIEVVGIVESPVCMGIESEITTVGSCSVALNVYVLNDYFISDTYTDVYLRFSDLREVNTFDDRFLDCISAHESDIETISEQRLPLRISDLHEEYEEYSNDLLDVIDSFSDVYDIQMALNDDREVRVSQLQRVMERLADSDSSEELENVFDQILVCSKNERELNIGDVLASCRKSYETISDALDSLDKATWMIRRRTDLAAVDSYKDNVSKVSALSKVFPVFFFMVSLLVSLTTMTRLVEERREQIGVLKAIGFSDNQILIEYLVFGLSASVLGCLVGFSAGFRLFPWAISNAYGMMYTLPPVRTPFRLNIAAVVSPVTVLGIVTSVLISCYSECRSVPAALMIPKSPLPGKRILLERISFIWNRVSFTYKVTFRNLFRYKKRFIMTIVGVAGCSALLVTGFGLKDSINDIVYKQFGEIYKYDLSVTLENEESLTGKTSVCEILDDSRMVQAWTGYYEENVRLVVNRSSEQVPLFVIDEADMIPDFITLRNRVSGSELQLTSSGVIITEKICEELGISEGDTVTVETDSGEKYQFTVDGITENYVSSFVYMSPLLYSNSFGQSPQIRSVLVRYAPGQSEIAQSAFQTDKNVLYFLSSESIRNTFDDSIRSIDGVILVLILSAGLLCAVVLYNLINVNICERKKELATIKVLGFYKNEVENYVFRETNILSMIGAVAGLFVGRWLHLFVVKTVEVNHIMFGRTIYPLSYLYAVCVSMVFTILVELVMKKNIEKIDIVESMKANE